LPYTLFEFLRGRSSTTLPTTIKIPEREFGAKRMSLRWEVRDSEERCQFHSAKIHKKSNGGKREFEPVTSRDK
jgi:hypothetical protein